MQEGFPCGDVIWKFGIAVAEHGQVMTVEIQLFRVGFPEPDTVIGFQQIVEN